MTRRLLLCLVALLAAASADAQAPVDPDCRDDSGVDRCASAQQARVRALFGARSIEEHRAAGDQVRRVFYVDGYGRDVAMIAFVRAPGREPMAYVHFPPRGERPAPQPFEAPVPAALWTDILRRSSHFDRRLMPLPRNPDEISICLHSWVYTIEANDPARGNGVRASLRRKTEDACADGLGEVFATDLQRAALSLFPACEALDPEQHRNPVAQLAACSLLSGDRLAAAAVMNRLDSFRGARRPEDGRLLAGLFTQGARIDWNGVRSVPSDPRLVDFWLGRLAADGMPGFYYQGVEGLSADRVRVTATLERSTDAAEGRPPTFSRARVAMIWTLTTVQEFQVESVTVGPWEVYRPG